MRPVHSIFLSFYDVHLEQLMWASPSIQRTMLLFDKAAVILHTILNISMVYAFQKSRNGSSDVKFVVDLQATVAASSTLMVFAGGALLFKSPEAYLRLRTRIMLVHRVSSVLRLYFFAAILRNISTAPVGLLDSVLSQQSEAAKTYTLVKLLLFRTSVVMVWTAYLVWPVRFKEQVFLLLLSLPAVFMHSPVVVDIIRDSPTLTDSTCRRASTINRALLGPLGVSSAGECPAAAPLILVSWVIIVAGILIPVYVHYHVELHMRHRFFAMRLMQTMPISDVTSSNVLGGTWFLSAIRLFSSSTASFITFAFVWGACCTVVLSMSM